MPFRGSLARYLKARLAMDGRGSPSILSEGHGSVLRRRSCNQASPAALFAALGCGFGAAKFRARVREAGGLAGGWERFLRLAVAWLGMSPFRGCSVILKFVG